MSNTQEQNIFKCECCEYQTTNKYTYARHLKSKLHAKRLEAGTKDIIYKCDKCPYSSQNKSNYTRHLKAHTNKMIHNYYCKICDKTVRCKYNLIKHKQSKKHCEKMTDINYKTVKELMTNENINNDKFNELRTEQKRKNKKGIFKKEKTEINNRIKGKGNYKYSYKEVNINNDESDDEQIKLKILSKSEVETIKENYDEYDENILPLLIYNVKCEFQKKDFTEEAKKKPQNEKLYDLIDEICEDILCDL